MALWRTYCGTLGPVAHLPSPQQLQRRRRRRLVHRVNLVPHQRQPSAATPSKPTSPWEASGGDNQLCATWHLPPALPLNVSLMRTADPKQHCLTVHAPLPAAVATRRKPPGSWRHAQPLARSCHFADALSPSLLEHLLKVDGGAAE